MANWAQILNNRVSNHFIQGPLMQIAFQAKAYSKLPDSTLNCLSVLCFCIQVCCYKGVPGILFQPLGLYSSCPIGAAQFQQTRAALFWPIRTVPFGPVKLQGVGALICMRTDQSETKGQVFCLYNPTPLWLWEYTFPFHRILKTVSSWLSWNTKYVSPEQSTPV